MLLMTNTRPGATVRSPALKPGPGRDTAHPSEGRNRQPPPGELTSPSGAVPILPEDACLPREGQAGVHGGQTGDWATLPVSALAGDPRHPSV